jgi:hypothetical protein
MMTGPLVSAPERSNGRTGNEMSRSTQFNTVLDDLFEKRTSWLRHIISKPKRGRTPRWSATNVTNAVSKLQEIASDAFAVSFAKREFERRVHETGRWHVSESKGRRFEARKRHFASWYEDRFGTLPCVYVFWDGKKCEYIGRSSYGGGRPSSHFDRRWINGLTRIDVYVTTSKRALPQLECLAIHRFQPARNKNRAATKKWTFRCPLCKVHRGIQEELRDIFAR